MRPAVMLKACLAIVLLVGLLPPLAAAQDDPGPEGPKEPLNAGAITAKEHDELAGPGPGCCGLLSAGGPDLFGYTFKDSAEPDGPAFTWIEISGTGTEVLLSDDSSDGPFPIGFPFDFYGNTYGDFHISSNGFLSFGAGSTSLSNECPLPSATTPNNHIALMWDDLDPGDTGDPVYHQTLAPCPLGGGACLVVQYQNYHHYPGGGDVAGTFEAVLFENGDILIQYLDAGTELGLGSTTGIENIDGTDGLTYICDTGHSLADDLAVRFYYPGAAPNFARSRKTATAKVELGQAIDYEVEIVNSGNLPAMDAMMADPIPEGATYIPGSLECSQGDCWYDAGDDAVYWTGQVGVSSVAGNRPTPGTLLKPAGDRSRPAIEQAPAGGGGGRPGNALPAMAPPGTLLEEFAIHWDVHAAGLVYDPGRDMVRFSHHSYDTAPVWDIDYPEPHVVLGSILLSDANPGWPATLNGRVGAGYDAATDTYFLPEYGGDGINAGSNIIEITNEGTILNAWEVGDGLGGNDSYDGSAIENIFDIAVVPGTPPRYFAVAYGDGSTVYEIDLIKTGAWWTPDTWGTLRTCTVPGLGDNLGIDYDAEHGLMYHTDWYSLNIVVTDLACNVVSSFSCPTSATYYDSATYIEGKAEPEVWVMEGDDLVCARCSASLYAACDPATLFFDDLEGGLGNWTATGLWNQEQEGDACGSPVAPFPSSDTAAYYGQDGICDYDTGATNSGALEMDLDVDLTGATHASLSFWSYEETECGTAYPCSWDQRYVDVSTDGGANWATVWASSGPEGEWHPVTVHLWPFTGGPLRVRFRFDTGDESWNSYFGWMVDDVRIEACRPTTVRYAVEAPAWCGEVINEATIEDPQAAPVVVEAATHVVDDLYVTWDFESDDGGFVADPGGEWEWGAPAYPPGLMAHSGDNVWGTDLHADADDEIGHHRLTKSLTLPTDENGVYLEWWDWYDQDGLDSISIQVDGTPVYERSSPVQSFWAHHIVDLSGWAGQTVDIVFDLEVCCSNPGPDGWYIDDLAIHGGCVPGVDVPTASLDAELCEGETGTLPLAVCNNDNLPLVWSVTEGTGTAGFGAPAPGRPSAAAANDRSSTSAPDGYTPALTLPERQGLQPEAGQVAILKDLDAWDSTAVEEILAAHGILYVVHTSAEFPSLDLSAFPMIVISSDQPQAFYDAYAAHATEFAAYVEDGGFLNFFAADFGWNGGFLTAPLPGGMVWTNSSQTYNVIDDPAHPVVQGVPDPFHGDSASHGHFTNLPAGGHIIASGQTSGLPTLVEYPLGDGWLIAFGQTLEISYDQRWDGGPILENTLLWSYSQVPFADVVPWLAQSPTSGMVLPGECADVDVTFDASGLAPGEYEASLTVWSNDPDTPQISVPVVMTVLVPVEIDEVDYSIDGCQVAFTSSVIGATPITYDWDMGDGSGSRHGANPTYTYRAPGGCFDVALVVANACGTDGWSGEVCVSCQAHEYLPLIIRDYP